VMERVKNSKQGLNKALPINIFYVCNLYGAKFEL
jgi:hypothetical protein